MTLPFLTHAVSIFRRISFTDLIEFRASRVSRSRMSEHSIESGDDWPEDCSTLKERATGTSSFIFSFLTVSCFLS